MRIVVTGITGFIGRNLLRTIDNDGNEYMCLVRRESDLSELPRPDNITYKITDFSCEDLREKLTGAEVVLHMAGQMGVYGIPSERFEEVNHLLTKRIVEACSSANVKQLIYVSTPGVIGFGKRLSTEDAPYAPRNIYERTKMMAELDVLRGGVKYTILRPDFVYGPGDTRRIKMYKNIARHRFVLTTSGNSYLSPTYVMDVIQGINKSVGNEKAYNEIFNLSADTDLTVREYLDTIARYFHTQIIHINIGYRLSVFLAEIIERFCNHILKRDGFVSKSKIDFLAIDHSTSSEKAQKLLGFHADHDFSAGFEETMKWCREKGLI